MSACVGCTLGSQACDIFRHRDQLLVSPVAATHLYFGVVLDTCLALGCCGCCGISIRQLVVTVTFHDVIDAFVNLIISALNNSHAFGNDDVTLSDVPL